MSRINTNISSLTAQKTLARSNSQLQEALTRLSTGLRINVGKDDPAGLIASEVLRSDIVSVQRAITNSQRANQLIGTADSALGQVSSLLNDVRALVSEAANSGALSEEQIAANQLQVDSSLEAIDRIAQTTQFQGRRLLDGSLDFITNSASAATKALGTFGAVSGTRAVGSFGTAVDNAARVTLSSAAGGGAVQFVAKSAGYAANGYAINITGGGGAAIAVSFDGTGKTIEISISGSVTAADVVSAVAANGSAAAVFSASVAAAGTVTAGAAGTTASGTLQNDVTLSAATVGAQYNGVQVTIVTSAATGSETAAYNTGTKTLSVYLNSASTTAQVVSAINTNGVFAASTSGAGLGRYTAGTTTSVTTGGGGDNAIFISATNAGTAYNDVDIVLATGAATGSETAAYNTATNTLTVTINNNSTATQVASAINATSEFGAVVASGASGNGTFSIGTTANVTRGAIASPLADLRIDQANFGTATSIGVSVQIDQQATQARLVYNGGALASTLNLEIGGKDGFEVFNFGSGTTINQIATAINLSSDATGVQASVSGTSLTLASVEYGSDAYVSARALTGTFSTVDASNASATRASGTDVSARINGISATGKGLYASVNTANLDISFKINEAVLDGQDFNFSITGGGATFQLGPDVVSNQQVRLGINGVSTATLGGASGKLYEIRTGGGKALADDAKAAAKIVEQVITNVTSLRGRLGAFQRTTLDTNIFTLNDALENLSEAESSIRDADFAAESARLTRAQILVQSGTSVLAVANQNPQNVLALLR